MSDAVSRGDFFQISAAAGAAGAVSPTTAAAAGGPTLPLKMRWYGGGVYELATPEDKSIVLVDAWIWSNTGFKAFGLDKPADLSSAAAYAVYTNSRNPDTFVYTLTLDHAHHMCVYFELLPPLVSAGVDVKSVGQSDLMRSALVPKFKAANLDYTQLVLNNGGGINLGGTVTYKGITFVLVPAVHSTFAGVPAVGFVIEIGGVRVYASGDTDVYGDMALTGMRDKPDLAVVSSGNGAFTMGPDDAAFACKLAGVAHAVPVHYAHNPLVLQTRCGDLFKAAIARVAPRTTVSVLRPGETTTLSVATKTR